MKQKSLKKNAVWNLLYSGSNLLFPLITAPYVSRVLGATNLGNVDFAKSFSQWFVIFAAFGITTYGVRSISIVRNNKIELNMTFSELFIINLLFSLVSSAAYLLIISQNSRFENEKSLFFIMTFSIILNAVNIDWFYQGIEEYSYITIRNSIIKLISMIFIFIMIKNPDDYVLYGIISILGVSLSGILNVINSRKYVKFEFEKLSLKKHIKSLSMFFLITLIINLYTNLDKTLLGFLDTTKSVAFLSSSRMVIGVGGTLSTSISSVAMPRASYYIKEDYDKFKKLIQIVPKYLLFLTLPIVVGIILLSYEIMFILGGNEFAVASSLLSVISVSIIFSSLSTFLHSQVLIPTANERLGLFSSILSSIVSIVLNLILIPKYSFMGAGISVVISEMIAMFSRYIFIKRKNFDFVKLLSVSVIKYLIGCIIMVVPVLVIKHYFESILLTFILSAVLGSFTYFCVLILLKEEIMLTYFKKYIRIKKTKHK